MATTAYFPEKVLILRAAYLPVLEQAQLRHGQRTIVLTPNTGHIAQDVLLLLQRAEPDIEQLKVFFRSSLTMRAEFSDGDRAILHACFQNANNAPESALNLAFFQQDTTEEIGLSCDG